MVKKLILLGIAFLMLFSLAACEPPNGGDEVLDHTLETQIKQDYVSSPFAQDDTKADEILIHKYYGTFNGNVVLSLSSAPQVIIDVFGGSETVADKTFSYSNPGYRILVWYNGDFYTLSQAFESDMLTNGNIQTIHSRHNSEKE